MPNLALLKLKPISYGTHEIIKQLRKCSFSELLYYWLLYILFICIVWMCQCVCILVDVALSNALQRFNYILETIFQHSEKWETPDVKETGKNHTMLCM